MKIFPNLAGGLRFYFGLARALALVFAAFWFLTLTFSPALKKLFGEDPKLMVSVGEALLQTEANAKSMITVGEARLQTEQNAVTLASDTAKPGSLAVVSLRGSLQADLLSKDAALVAALRWTIYPCIAVFVAFTWLLFSSLRAVCANIDQGEAFSEKNLQVVKRVGLILIASSLAGFAVQLWASHAMGGYLTQHVVFSGIKSGGTVHFSLPGGLFPFEGGIVTGFVVLLLTAAFRQGLNLKTENDLTV